VTHFLILTATEKAQYLKVARTPHVGGVVLENSNRFWEGDRVGDWVWMTRLHKEQTGSWVAYQGTGAAASCKLQ
jgi:hypothetical protein